MGALGKRALFDVIRSINSTTFTGAFQAVGTPLTFPAVLMKFVNNTGVLVTVSIDAVNTIDVVPAGSAVIYDFGSDAQSTSGDERLAFPANTQIYVNGTASTGLFYIVYVYQG